MPLIDATALLWRLHLEKVDVGVRFTVIADEWQERQERDHGFYAFNDFHAMLAFAATGRHEAMMWQLDRLATAAAQEGSNGVATREVCLPLAHGIAEFALGRYAAAIDWIEPVRDIAQRFGGSHAQRDLITLTLIEAALRANQRSRARHYLAERVVHKPASAWAHRLTRRMAPSVADPVSGIAA